MRETGDKGSDVRKRRSGSMRMLRLAVILLGVGLVLGTGAARAQEDDDQTDDRTFERRLIDNLMSGLGGKGPADKEIEYRERSPLVLPSNVNQLPPPETKKQALAPNWPKDPDIAARKAARELAKQKPKTPEEARRPLMPSELATRGGREKVTRDDTGFGSTSTSKSSIMLMPSQLGYTGGLFSSVLGGSNKSETETFTTEPEREELTQPPAGYQTPSPNFAYGTGPAKAPIEVCDPTTARCEKRWQ